MARELDLKTSMVSQLEQELRREKMRISQHTETRVTNIPTQINSVEVQQVPAAVSVRRIDRAAQVETDDMFQRLDSRLEDLRRATQKAERDKLAAEAFSIQTKAELARAEHRVSCLEKELDSHRGKRGIEDNEYSNAYSSGAVHNDSRLTNSSTLAKEVLKLESELKESNRQLHKSRQRESELQRERNEVEHVAQRKLAEAFSQRDEVERIAQQSLLQAEAFSVQLNRMHAQFDASDKKVLPDEERAQVQLRAVIQLFQEQVESLQQITANAAGQTFDISSPHYTNQVSLTTSSTAYHVEKQHHTKK